MKKLVVTMITLLCCEGVYALPVGNPTEAGLFLNGVWCESSCCDPCFSWCDAWNIRLGFYGDYVFDRKMEVDNGSVRSGGLWETRINTNAAYLVLNICNYVDVFSTLGSSHIFIRTNSQTLGTVAALHGVRSEIDFDSHFSWSVGARTLLWECDCFGIGIEGQYFQTKPDISYFQFGANSGQVFYPSSNRNTRYREWQVGLGTSYRFAISCPSFAMIPYAAVKWAGSQLHTNDPFVTGNLTLSNLENQRSWGLALGMSLTLCDMIGVTVEGRWFDETAIYVNGQIRF